MENNAAPLQQFGKMLLLKKKKLKYEFFIVIL